MRIVIQHCGTHEFLGMDNQWTTDLNALRVFKTAVEAVRYLRELKIQNARVYMLFDDPKYNVEILATDDCHK